MDRFKSRRNKTFRPDVSAVESRLLLSLTGLATGALGPNGFLSNPPGTLAVRPNTPVLPFGAPLATATFLDPTTRTFNGNHVVVGQKTYVGPYSTLNATTGFIKIGSSSAVLDNANVISNPNKLRFNPPSVRIGDQVQVGYGATVLGPSKIGDYGAGVSKPTGIGPNAVINGATIEAGAVVGALARVGPGVTIKVGLYVKPGANVTTDAEGSNPALGKVVNLPASILSDLVTSLTRDAQLASGYTNLYQGNAATGANPGVDPLVTGVNSGNLAAVSGASAEPGNATTAAATGINFEPRAATPQFPGPYKPLVPAILADFPARVTGDARFLARAHTVARRLGKSNAIRADQGQPLTFASSPTTGRAVTINSPLGGTVTTAGVTKTVGSIVVGKNLVAQSGAVILGGPGTTYPVGDDVTIGSTAVIERSTIGAGAVIGARSYVLGSTVAAGQNVPPGTILINNQVVGTIQW